MIGVAGLVVKLTHRINQITRPVPNTFLTNYIFSVAVEITVYSWLQSIGKIHLFFFPPLKFVLGFQQLNGEKKALVSLMTFLWWWAGTLYSLKFLRLMQQNQKIKHLGYALYIQFTLIVMVVQKLITRLKLKILLRIPVGTLWYSS